MDIVWWLTDRDQVQCGVVRKETIFCFVLSTPGPPKVLLKRHCYDSPEAVLQGEFDQLQKAIVLKQKQAAELMSRQAILRNRGVQYAK